MNNILKKIIRYFLTFVFVIILMIVLLVMEKSIPNARSRDNLIKSEKYYYDYYDNQLKNMKNLKDEHIKLDVNGELYHLGIIYLEKNKNPWQEFIEMNMEINGTMNILNKRGFISFKIDEDYARHWNGELIVLKPLLTFFTMPQIYNIYLIVFSIIFIILLLYLMKHSMLLSILFAISAIMSNIFFTTKCSILVFVFLISMIASIIVIKMYEKNSKNIDLVFLISGMLAVYFDLISCETITLTLPMFIYLYLHIKDNKKVKSKEIIKYILLWLGGYVFTYLVKWLILVIHFKGMFRVKVLEKMIIRIYYENESILGVFLNTIKKVPGYFYPYDLISLKIVIILFGLIAYIINIKKDKKNRTSYIWLLLVSLIPFIRYLVLSSHSDYHNFFTYRAFIIFLLFILINIGVLFEKLKNKYNFSKLQ